MSVLKKVYRVVIRRSKTSNTKLYRETPPSRFLFQTWIYTAYFRLICLNEVGSAGLEFSSV